MPRRILEGNVVSAKTDKTVTVLVERRFMHPVYKKYIKKTSKYTAHDEANTCKEGDRVSIIECRPMSKTKRWTLVGADDVVAKEAPRKAEAKKAPAKKTETKAAEKKAPAKKPAAKKTTAKKTTAKKKDA